MAWITRDLSHFGSRYSVYAFHSKKPKGVRKKDNGSRVWDGCEQIFFPANFHRLFTGPRLKPGEGPVEVKTLHLR